MSERYPQPIANFAKWYGAHMVQIETTTTERGVDEALQAIREYASEQWCLPERLKLAEKAAEKSLARIRRRAA